MKKIIVTLSLILALTLTGTAAFANVVDLEPGQSHTFVDRGVLGRLGLDNELFVPAIFTLDYGDAAPSQTFAVERNGIKFVDASAFPVTVTLTSGYSAMVFLF